MPSWIETKREIEKRGGNFDTVRRERIQAVEQITGRPLLIYVTDFLSREKVEAAKGEVGIDGNDKLGFVEVIRNIKGENLDILIHSPGGDPGAAESIVDILRSNFTNIRFLVPDQAKSAATMICCAGDEILMDEKSELGPIDPQISLVRGDGKRITAPAQAIIDQFDVAKNELAKNPNNLPAWLPILQPLGPALLTQCEVADKLSRSLVETWLQQYMFKTKQNAPELAKKVADFLAAYQTHLSHGRRIGIDQLQELELNILDLRHIPDLQGAIWDLYTAISCTFDGTGAYKIIENGCGDAYIRRLVLPQVQIPIQRQKPQIQPAQTKPKRRRRKKSR